MGKVKVWIQQTRSRDAWSLRALGSVLGFALRFLRFQVGRALPTWKWHGYVSTRRKGMSLSQSLQHISQGWLVFTGLDWTSAQIPYLPLTHNYGRERSVPWLASPGPHFHLLRQTTVEGKRVSLLIRRRTRCWLNRKQLSPYTETSCSVHSRPFGIRRCCSVFLELSLLQASSTPKQESSYASSVGKLWESISET